MGFLLLLFLFGYYVWYVLSKMFSMLRSGMTSKMLYWGLHVVSTSHGNPEC